MYFPKATTRKQLNESVLDMPSKPLGRTLPKVGSYTLPKIPIATTKAAFSPRLPSLLQQDSSKKVYTAFSYLFHILNYFHPVVFQMLTMSIVRNFLQPSCSRNIIVMHINIQFEVIKTSFLCSLENTLPVIHRYHGQCPTSCILLRLLLVRPTAAQCAQNANIHCTTKQCPWISNDGSFEFKLCRAVQVIHKRFSLILNTMPLFGYFNAISILS